MSRKNIPSTQPLSKLDYWRIGPFWVVRMVGSNAAQLDLGCAYFRHPLPSTSPLPSLRDLCHVAGNLDFCVRGRPSPEYLLLWINGTPSDNTWVPLHDVCLDLDPYLLAFHARYLLCSQSSMFFFSVFLTVQGRHPKGKLLM